MQGGKRKITLLNIKHVIFFFILTILYVTNASIANADIIKGTSAEHRKQMELYEKNGVADTICMFIKFITSGIARAGALFIVAILAFAAFTGKLNVSMAIAFALGVGGFFAAPSILNLAAPNSDIKRGCNCKEVMLIGYDADTDQRIYANTGLNPDCTPKKGAKP